MRVAETVDDRVGVMITGAAIPTGEARIRAELDHAERPRGAGKRVTVAAGADERIDVPREILLRERQRRKQQQAKKTQQFQSAQEITRNPCA